VRDTGSHFTATASRTPKICGPDYDDINITIFLSYYYQGNMVKDCVVTKLSGNSATSFSLRLLFECSHFLGTFFPFYFYFSFYALCNSISVGITGCAHNRLSLNVIISLSSIIHGDLSC
jgi:hypothetical protein